MVGRSLGHYKILEPLGEGGMGTVYLARDSKLGRDVAIKVIRPDRVCADDAQPRLWREARAAASLEHPFICKVFEVLDSDEGVCIVMEHVTGETLAEWVRREDPSAAEILRVGSEVAEALAAAHDAGIIHRDIKPANVLLAPSGHPKVMDFGLAKPIAPSGGEDVDAPTATETQLTGTGYFLGTPGYAAPETLRGAEADHRSDLFALGCLLYYLSTRTARSVQGISSTPSPGH